MEYCRIEAWPLERTKRSRSGHDGSSGSCFRMRLYKTLASGASAIAVPWWPLLARSGASMAKPRMMLIAWASMSGGRVVGIVGDPTQRRFGAIPAAAPAGPARTQGDDPVSGWREQGERDDRPRAAVDAA